jgi:hypothetical protein
MNNALDLVNERLSLYDAVFVYARPSALFFVYFLWGTGCHPNVGGLEGQRPSLPPLYPSKHQGIRHTPPSIALFVLPPKKPQYNGGVERGNRIFKEEFYARAAYDSLGHCRALLKTAVHKYNTYRPHYALKGSTPSEYAKIILLKDAA